MDSPAIIKENLNTLRINKKLFLGKKSYNYDHLFTKTGFFITYFIIATLILLPYLSCVLSLFNTVQHIFHGIVC